jgi:hypothetical protein
VVIERIAALRGQMVNIVLNQADLNPGGNAQGGRYGSKVTVMNRTTTQTNILGMYVYNKADVAASAVYFLDILSPAGQKDLYVLSSAGLPIVDGQDYAARLSVYGNGKIALIDKEFSSDGRLYSTNPDGHLRTITLSQSDLPPELIETFVPVTGITIDPSPYTITSYTESNLDGSNPAITYNGTRNLNSLVVVGPDNATTKSPITWAIVSGGGSPYVSLNPSTSVFTVTGIAPAGNRTVTVRATIQNAAGTITAKAPFSADIQILLAYVNTVKTQKVTGITLTPRTIEAGDTLDLKTLASLAPVGANINGVPITVDDLVWTISGSTGSTLNSGSILTAGQTAGTVTITATLPASKNGGTSRTASTTVTITQTTPPVVDVTGVTTSGTPWKVNYYTETVNGTKTVYVNTPPFDGTFLGPYVAIAPLNATNKSQKWSIVPGDPLASAVVFDSALLGSLRVKPSDEYSGVVSDIAAYGKEVHVQLMLTKHSIPSQGDPPASGPYPSNAGYTVTLVEHHSRPVQAGELSLEEGPTIEVGETVSLNDLVHLPPEAMFDNVSLTAADLEWSIVSGASNGSLPSGGSVLTGTAAGTVTVRATLPANKNRGTQRTAETTITVEPASGGIPNSLTLRIFKTRMSGDTYTDKITRFVLIPRNESYSEAVKRTGHTSVQWAPKNESYDYTYKSKFEKYFLPQYPGFRDYDFSANPLEDNQYVDIVVPWPTGGNTGYFLFFYEKDSRVRGYVNPWEWNPTGNARNKNLGFFLDFDYLFNNQLLPMKGNKQVVKGENGAVEVIPLYYNSYQNVGTTMKAQGVGTTPVPNYDDITKGQ